MQFPPKRMTTAGLHKGDMKELSVSSNFAARVKRFISEYQLLGDEAEILIHPGEMTDNEGTNLPALVISFDGSLHGFTTDQARSLARAAEDAAKDFPDDDPGLPALIYALRTAADEVEASFGYRGRQ